MVPQNQYRKEYFEAKALERSPEVLAFYLGRWSTAAVGLCKSQLPLNKHLPDYLAKQYSKLAIEALFHCLEIKAEFKLTAKTGSIIPEFVTEIARLEEVVRQAHENMIAPKH